MAAQQKRIPPVMVNADENGDMKIVRDSTFSRAVVDEILPIPLSKDVELSCLQLSPILNAKLDVGDGFAPDLDDVFVEVARIRTGYPEAVALATRILHLAIERNRVYGDKIAEAILQWTRAAAEARSENQEQKSENG